MPKTHVIGPPTNKDAHMLRYCLDCTTGYAVDLQFCPHCGSTRWGYSTPEREAVQAEPVRVEAAAVAAAETAPAKPARRVRNVPAPRKGTP